MNEQLKELKSKSIYIIRNALSNFKNPAVLWSTGKDSTVCLDLIRKASPNGKIEIPVVHIDTGRKFKEIYEFRDKIAKEWKLNLIIAKNYEKIDNVSPEINRFECCNELKTKALQKCIKENEFDAIFVSIRRDEQQIRNKERYMSPRDKEFKWNVSRLKEGGDSGLEALQDTEMFGWDLYATDFGEECEHIRVHPLLHWTELDCWRYIKEENLPINSLYFSKNGFRYRSLGCMPCTSPIKSNANNIDKIIKELEKTKEGERAGRAQDKEELMYTLRALGYM